MCAGLTFQLDLGSSCVGQSPLWIAFFIVHFSLFLFLCYMYISSICSFIAKMVHSFIVWYRKRKWSDEEIQFFLEHVSVTSLMTHLLSKELLTPDERKQIDQQSNEQEKVMALMRVMVSKDEEKLQGFKQLVEEIYPGYRKGRGMSVKHRTALLKCRAAIVEDLESKEICSKLYSRELLNAQDKEWIEAASTRRQKAERILDTLPGKGDDAFSVFLNILKERQSTKFLAEMLEKECQECKETNELERIEGDCSNVEKEMEHISGVETTIRLRIKIAIKNLFEAVRPRFTRKSYKSSAEKPKKKFSVKMTRKSRNAGGEGRTSNRRMSVVSRRGWIVTHIGSRVSLEQAWFALRKILPDSEDVQDQETRPEKGDINEILCNLNPEEFQNFMEIIKDEFPAVELECPVFSSN